MVERAAQTGPVDERRAKLRVLRDDAEALIGRIDGYLADDDLDREAAQLRRDAQARAARANATLRESMIERGMASAEVLAEFGMLSHEELDALEEEGLLEAALEELDELLGEAVSGTELELHPHDRSGRFREKYGHVFSRRTSSPVVKGRVGRVTHPTPRGAKKPKPEKVVEKAVAKKAAPPPSELKTDEEKRFFELTGSFDEMIATEHDPERLAEALKLARQVGEVDWPKPGPIAKRLLGSFPGTFERHSVPVTLPDGTKAPLFRAERHKLHEAIIDAVMRERGEKGKLDPKGRELVAPDPADRWALFMGGGPASGKSSALNMDENADVVPPDAVIIDPDEIKGLLPEYREMVAGGDRYAATAAHEESSHIAAEILRRARAKGLNVVMDGTGDSGKEKTERELYGKVPKFVGKMIDAREHGYNVRVFYVNAPTEVAEVRATKRAFREGRWVPGVEIRQQHKGVSANAVTLSELVGEHKDLVQDVRGFDTAVFPPQRMFTYDENGFRVDSEDLWRKFQEKANEDPNV